MMRKRLLVFILSGVFLPSPAFSSGCARHASATVCVLDGIRLPGLRYDAPIAFVVPDSLGETFQPEQIILYLQGFRGVCRAADGSSDSRANPEQTMAIFDIVGQFNRAIEDAAKPRSLLVFPVSYGHNDDYKNQLVSQLSPFVAWVEKEINAAPGVRWHIAGHSGAGAVISAALSRQADLAAKFDSAILLDATYSMGAHLTEWRTIARSQRGIFIQSVYQEGSSTATGSRTLQSELNALKTNGENTLKHPVEIASTRDAHCHIPNRYFAEMLAPALRWSPTRAGWASSL